jgi:aldose 1-epimerase
VVPNTPPSGRQVEIHHRRQRAIVVEVGGGLREYQVDGQPVLEGYALQHMADGGRGQPLLPWPNRLCDGRYVFGGQQLQLPIDEVSRHNAIHGLTRWLSWSVGDLLSAKARMEHTIHPRPGYPFALQLSIEYALSDAGLTVRTMARNIGQDALPFGAGQHPYVTVGTPLVDSATLQVPAESRLELDSDRRLPTGRALSVEATDHDFRAPRPIGPLLLDDCYTDLRRDSDGLARVILSDPRAGRSVVLWMDQRCRFVMVFSGDSLAAERRRRGLAVEPMTCPPDAFRSQTDLIVLEPDESIAFEWGLTAHL